MIRTLTAECGSETLIGAGTVLDPETAQACIDAGAKFIVSPALNEETIVSLETAADFIKAGESIPKPCAKAMAR